MENINKGLVVKSTGSWHTVMHHQQIIHCKVAGKIRTQGIKATNPVAVGDRVFFQVVDEKEKTGVITAIEARKNYIIRKATKLSKQYHLIASNIDQAILMVSITQPETSFEFIDRFLLNTESFHIPTVIVVNKTDLINSPELNNRLNYLLQTYENMHYNCILASVLKDNNIAALISVLANKISIISGNSGVGKSSLIKAISPGTQIQTANISDYHQAGRHTTTFSQMFTLDNNIKIIDTPGIKGFGIVDIDRSETGLYFKDIFRISQQCKFTNCTHIHEPGCAVIQAFDNGTLAHTRYQSYLSIREDSTAKYR